MSGQVAKIADSAIEQENGQRRSLLWLALLLAFLAALWVQGSRIGDAYAVEEDFRKFHYMQRFQEPGLYPVDPMTASYVRDYQVGPVLLVIDTTSPAYSLLFQAVSYIIPVVTFAKIIGIPLLLLSAYYLYRIGERLKGPGTGLALALAFTALNLASPRSLTVLTGLQRAFMAPLLLAIVYYLLTERDWAAAIALVLGGLIYLPAFALGAATYGLSLLSWNEESGRPGLALKPVPPLVIATVLVLLVHVPTISRQVDGLSDAAAAAQVAEEPVAADTNEAPTHDGESVTAPALTHTDRSAGSRYELFRLFPLVGRMGLSDGMALAAYIAVLSAMSVYTFLLDPTSLERLPREIKLLGLAGILCFALAWVAYWLTDSFPLYLPSRYSQAALFLFTLIYVVVNFEESLHRTATWLSSNQGRLFWLAVPFSLLVMLLAIFLPPDSLGSVIGGGLLRWVLILLVIVLLALALTLWRRRDTVQSLPTADAGPATNTRRWALFGGLLFLVGLGNIYVLQSQFLVSSPDERELFRFLESLPVDVMVSGNPCDLDGVPLFAKRMVLFSCERPQSDSLAMDTLLAYYAAKADDIAAYCRRHGVDYLVVNNGSFEPAALASGHYYFEPFDSYLQPILSQQQTFAMPTIVEEAKVFANQTYAVVPCDSLALASQAAAE